MVKGDGVKMGWRQGGWHSRRWWNGKERTSKGATCWVSALTFQCVWTVNHVQTAAVEWWSILLANVRSRRGRCSANFDKADLVISCSHWSGLEWKAKRKVTFLSCQTYIIFKSVFFLYISKHWSNCICYDLFICHVTLFPLCNREPIIKKKSGKNSVFIIYTDLSFTQMLLFEMYIYKKTICGVKRIFSSTQWPKPLTSPCFCILDAHMQICVWPWN